MSKDEKGQVSVPSAFSAVNVIVLFRSVHLGARMEESGRTSSFQSLCLPQRACGKEPHVGILVVLERLQSGRDLGLHELSPSRGITERGSNVLEGFGHIESDVWNGIPRQLKKHVEDTVTHDLDRERWCYGL